MGLLSMSKQNKAKAHAPEMQGRPPSQDGPAEKCCPWKMLSTEKYSHWKILSLEKTLSTGKCSPLAAPALSEQGHHIALIQSPVPQKGIYWELKGTSRISSPNET